MHRIYTSSNHHIKNPHAFLDALESPSLLLRADKKQVVTANKSACELFGKDLSRVEGRNGGQVINCVHAFNVEGLCKGLNCENCKIKNAIINYMNAKGRQGKSIFTR